MLMTPLSPVIEGLRTATGPQYERFDGARWRDIETDDAFLTMTSTGRALLASNRILDSLVRYGEAHDNGRESPNGIRRFIAQGGNARVFSLGSLPIAIKEKNPDSNEDLNGSLTRMDYLSYAIDAHCPRWISTPSNYAVLALKAEPERQFMLMQKVDAGVTFGDIFNIEQPPREDHIGEEMHAMYGVINPDFRDLLHKLHEEYKLSMTKALRNGGLRPEIYLSDIDNPHNTIVEPMAQSINGVDYRFSVIDQ